MNFEILIEAIKILYPLQYNHFLWFTVINTFQITRLTTLRMSMTLKNTIYNILLLLYMCLLYVVVCTILVESVLSGISSNQPYLSMSKYFHPGTLIQERKGGSLQNFCCICFWNFRSLSWKDEKYAIGMYDFCFEKKMPLINGRFQKQFSFLSYFCYWNCEEIVK